VPRGGEHLLVRVGESASEGSGTTSAIARPDGTLLCHQPYGKEGLLVADLDLGLATGLLASRLRTSPM
jgi:predicted amidohydrolase